MEKGDLKNQKEPQESQKFQEKIALVTGASHGLGRAFAKLLTQKGVHVLALGRDVKALESLDDHVKKEGGQITLVPLDLTDYEGLNRLGRAIFDKWGHLDFLIANAAQLGTLTPLTHANPAQWEQILTVNLTAQWYLLRTLDELLERSPAGRIIGVTSSVVQNYPPFWGSYTVAKAGFEALIKTYAHEKMRMALRVNLLDPGRMQTRMRKQAFPGENQSNLPKPFDVAQRCLPLLSVNCKKTGALFDGRTGKFLTDGF